MRKSNLRTTAAWQALALLGAGLPAAFIAATPAHAQDYSSGAVLGTVNDASGNPVAGAQVVLRSVAQGQARNLTTDSSGSFSAVGLAPGTYDITVTASGQQTFTGTVDVLAARSNQVTVDLAGAAPATAGGSGQTIVVTGRLRQATTQGVTGRNVNVAKINEQLPIGHSITDIVLLAPTATKGVSGFVTASGEAVPSVGGSSVAENAYYINGLNITNPDTYVGSSRVPFYFYQNVDIQTGGYPAEFGKATGGVINATTKSGSNVPFIGLHLDWEPSWLAAPRRDRGDPTNQTEIGRFYQATTRQATLEAGGAIIPDHFFAYGLIQANRNKQENLYPSAGVFETTEDRDPFWGVKLDGYINPTQHAEFTIFDTRNTQNILDYDYTGTDDGSFGSIDPNNPDAAVQESGGLNWVARYTGEVTDWLTLSGAYGKTRDHGTFGAADQLSNYIEERRFGQIVSIGNPFAQTNVLDTKRRFYRGDADIRVSLMGQHHFRLGFDQEDLSETKELRNNGEVPVYFRYRTNGIQYIYEVLGGDISAANTSYYLQDSWTDLVDGLTLNIGIRNDRFKNYNLSGEQFMDLKNNWGPRLGFSYTPPSADNWRIFGSYGRYFIPPAMNLGFRGKDLFFGQYYQYPAGTTAATFPIDPATGLPLLNVGPPLSGVSGYGSPCPTTPDFQNAPGNPTPNGSNTCLILGAGVQDPAIAKLAVGAKATYENEFILGTRYRMNSLWDFGLSATHRVLKRVSEDTDFGPQLYEYWNCDTVLATDAGGNYLTPNDPNLDRCEFYSGNSAYYIWNPGSEVTINDWYAALQGDVEPLTLTNLPFPKPKRKYTAIVLDFNRADDGLWFAGGSVTWSRSIGSNEGTVKSDAGNAAQDDAGSNADLDYPGFADNAYGLLPNHRKWTFKLFGSFRPMPNLLLGTNIFVQSPMHGSCFAHHPTDPFTAGYGAQSYFCAAGDLDFAGNYSQVVDAKRGTGWKSDWLKQVDLSARYNIPLGLTGNRRVTLRADVFNIFDSSAVRQRYGASTQDKATYPVATAANPNPTFNGIPIPVALQGTTYYVPSPTYLTPQSRQTPRYVRLGLDFLWGGAPRVAAAPVEVLPPPPVEAPPATQTCADGTVILATEACPAAPPPPPVATPERG